MNCGRRKSPALSVSWSEAGLLLNIIVRDVPIPGAHRHDVESGILSFIPERRFRINAFQDLGTGSL